MKSLRILPILILALSTAAFAQITLNVNEPLTGSTYTSPVTVSATASSPDGISKWDVYLDNVLVLEQTNTSTPAVLDATIPSTTGSHSVVVKAWSHMDTDTYDTEDITVNASPLPTPPANASEFANLQNVSGNPGTWTAQSTQTGGSGTGTSSMTFNIASPLPSLSGAAMEIASTNTTSGENWNTLFFRHLGCSTLPGGVCTGITHFETDFWVYYASGNAPTAYEYDPDLYIPSHDFFMSMQFRAQPTDQAGLYLYSKAAPGWEPLDNKPIYSLPSITTGAWHHIQTYGTMDQSNDLYTYEDFIYDGQVVFQNIGQNYGAGTDSLTGYNLNIQQQLDSTTATGTLTEYLDNYNFWVW